MMGTLPSVNITDNGVLAIDHLDNLNFANTISGSGSVVQEGAGSFLHAERSKHIYRFDDRKQRQRVAFRKQHGGGRRLAERLQ